MKTYMDCIPCFCRQALATVRMVTPDESIHESVMRRVLVAVAEMDMKLTPPHMGQYIHRVIREATGRKDPYSEAKDRFNRVVLDMLPTLKQHVTASSDPLETAIRLSIAGNMIDSAVASEITPEYIQDGVTHALHTPFEGDVAGFRNAVMKAKNILYLADNAGEIVFDKLLLELLPLEKITLGVRGYPVINDALRADAETAGLCKIMTCIDNGSDAPGTILDDCSRDFQERFSAADLIIAKGQGNYETLSRVEKPVVFLFKAKCPVIARDADCSTGSLVLIMPSNSRNDAVNKGDHHANV